MNADIRVSPEISFRHQLADLCDRHMIQNAAEIGVHQGEFSAQFLSRWNGKYYACIDNYQPFPEMMGPRANDKACARALLERFKERVSIEFVEKDALMFLRSCPDAHLAFIYIDACHEFWAVSAEIMEAWRVVRPGGILAGHDYDHTHPGVMLAVQAFAERTGQTIWLTQEHGFPWSWYTYKPEPQAQ